MRITDLIAGLSAILWVAVMASIVMVTLQASRGTKVKNGRAIIIAVLAARSDRNHLERRAGLYRT